MRSKLLFTNVLLEEKYNILKEFLLEEKYNYDNVINKKIVKNIINLGYNLLKENDFKIKSFDSKRSLFEIRKDTIYQHGNTLNHVFDLHVDDYGGVDCEVETIIFYLENTLNGGNLLVKLDNNDIIIDTHENNCIMLSGNLEHMVTLMSGIGNRIAVIIQFEYDK